MPVIFLGIAVGISIQLHASAWLLLPAILIFWLIWRPQVKNWRAWVGGAATFLLTLLPWIVYEITNNFANLRGVIAVLQEKEPTDMVARFSYVGENLATVVNGLLFGNFLPLWLVALFVVGIAFLLIWRLLLAKKKISALAWFLIILSAGTWLFAWFYSGDLWPHYFLVVFIPVFLAVAVAFTGRWWRYKMAKLMIIALVILMSYAGIYAYIKHSVALAGGSAVGDFGVSLRDEKQVVDIISQTGEASVDLKLITRDNFHEAFAYLLEQAHITIDPEAGYEIIIYRPSESPEIETLLSGKNIVNWQRRGNLSVITIKK